MTDKTVKRYDPDESFGSNFVAVMREVPEGDYVTFEDYTRLRSINASLLGALQALPNNFDLNEPDAADFVDHANDFITAMRLARAAIAKAEGE